MRRKRTIYEVVFKRPLDFFLSLIAIIILSPVFLIISLMVRIKLGSPVIFKQPRPGKDEKIFNLYKFRSMTNDKDEEGDFLPDEQRLTKFGKILRLTSLDELPSLLNILRGSLSIVGPRPQLVKDMWFMTEEQRNRHCVRGGLTGLAQVNGRNSIVWEKRLNYDLKYIDKITFIGDLIIIIKTIGKVFKRSNISTDGMETSEDFGDYLVRTNKITLKEYNSVIDKNKNGN